MPRLGLRAKFFLYSNTLIVVTMTFVTLLAVAHERRSRLEAIERRGRSICEAMALPITDSLMYEDLALLLEPGLITHYIQEMQARNRDLLRYVVVTDERGKVTHSTDWNMLGKTFRRGIPDDGLGAEPVVEILATPDEVRTLEVRTPLNISTRSWGSLVVGFSLDPIEEQVSAIARRAALMALVLMIGNSLLTAIYVETLIRPILALNSTIKRAARGDLTVRTRARAGAEVGELADAFNRMMEEMEDARDRDLLRQAQLVHTEKMAAIGTLAAGVAHEVNNPLAGILACVENIRADRGDPRTVERYLDVIHDGLRRIEHTVANLLDFSRRRTMELAPTSINHRLRHVVELADYQLRQSCIDVHYELDAEDPCVMADPFQVDQLFLNLVLNAQQSMPEGGRLSLRTFQKDGQVVAEVCDTGVGIPEEMRERIFDPFFTTRAVGDGTGLGLTVSDSIVSSHGGSLQVQSTPDEGSTFRVSFPKMTGWRQENR